MAENDIKIVNGLPIGTILHGGRSDYKITGYRSQDGFGILYHAKCVGRDSAKGRRPETPVMIREFFMHRCSGRDTDGVTVVTPDDIAPTVNNFYDSFVIASKRCEAATSKVPGIVDVLELMSANNTSYYVVEYLNGETLEDYVHRKGPLTVNEARAMLKPIFDGVAHLHSFRVMHTDIYPRHIRFTKSGTKTIPVLFSLYASKHFDDSGLPIQITPMLVCRDGYAPPEQYSVVENFMPQIDIYALGAVVVFALTGQNPPDSRTITEKDIRALLPPTLPETLTSTIIHAMQPDYSSRPSSISSFKEELLNFFEENEQYNTLSTMEDRQRKMELYREEDSESGIHKLVWKLASFFKSGKQ